jgi:hypothetical protein
MSDRLPTPRDYLGVHTVRAFCVPCIRPALLDIAAPIAAGHGDTPLVKLPLRCSQCGQPTHSIMVSGKSYTE